MQHMKIQLANLDTRDCSVEGTKAKHIFYFWFFIASLENDRDKILCSNFVGSLPPRNNVLSQVTGNLFLGLKHCGLFLTNNP